MNHSQDNVLVLTRVHGAPELVGRSPQGVLKPQWLTTSALAHHQDHLAGANGLFGALFAFMRSDRRAAAV